METIRKATFTKTDTAKVKAIAIILMMFHHLFRVDRYIVAFQIKLPSFLNETQVTRIATDARICVWIFVFLSAYGVATKLCSNPNGESVSKTIFKQWWALMKPYWFVYMLLFFVSFLFPQSAYAFHQGSWPRILADFIGIAEFIGTDLWMGVWWYMCFAQVLLLILPLLLILVDKIGVLILPIAYLTVQFVNPGIKSTYGGYYGNYLYAVVLAVLFVKYELFERLGKKREGMFATLEAIFFLSAFLMLAHWKVSLSSTAFSGIATLLSAFSVAFLCLFAQKYLTAKWMESVLAYLGKHSGNIYLVHFAVYIYLPQIVFCTKTVVGSVAILLGISLVISIILEGLKKLIQYDKLMNVICDKILKCVSGSEYKKVI